MKNAPTVLLATACAGFFFSGCTSSEATNHQANPKHTDARNEAPMVTALVPPGGQMAIATSANQSPMLRVENHSTAPLVVQTSPGRVEITTHPGTKLRIAQTDLGSAKVQSQAVATPFPEENSGEHHHTAQNSPDSTVSTKPDRSSKINETSDPMSLVTEKAKIGIEWLFGGAIVAVGTFLGTIVLAFGSPIRRLFVRFLPSRLRRAYIAKIRPLIIELEQAENLAEAAIEDISDSDIERLAQGAAQDIELDERRRRNMPTGRAESAAKETLPP